MAWCCLHCDRIQAHAQGVGLLASSPATQPFSHGFLSRSLKSVEDAQSESTGLSDESVSRQQSGPMLSGGAVVCSACCWAIICVSVIGDVAGPEVAQHVIWWCHGVC